MNINSLLTQINALTEARDDDALKFALIKMLNSLLSLSHGRYIDSSALYHINDAIKSDIKRYTTRLAEAKPELNDTVKQAVTQCATSGKVRDFNHDGVTSIKLYPVKTISGKIEEVISVESHLDTMQTDGAINLILSIYHNYTALINDNESDTLTGLLNRKTFDSKINKLLAQMQSDLNRKKDNPAQSYFLVIFDIDHFKHVNDDFGHLIGDEVLLMFAQLMQQSFREGDALFRFGGEEFVGLFECANSSNIATILERFRAKIEHHPFSQVGKITVSAGYTEILDFDAASILIDRADAALYFAKNNGRNQIAFYEELVTNGLLEESRKEGDIELFD
ncbi:MAG: GGDEF domain-containing protein [Methylotenera sp.]|nr:GGDEF domain-containing protein [Methylotenera sp.]